MNNTTIGQRIAAFRKACGMTQRELAEKLNVSDKTISHWECDESAPDLVLLPLLADALNVSLEDIVRGKVASPQPEGAASAPDCAAPGEPLASHSPIGNMDYTTVCRILTVLSCALSGVGFLAAMICNFAFYRARLGFFIGCGVFTAAAALACIGIALSPSGDKRNARSALSLATASGATILVLLAASLPLILYAPDATVGLTGSALMEYLFIYASGGAFAAFLARRAALACLKHSGQITESAQDASARVRVNCAVTATVFIVAVTMFFQASFNANAPWGLVKGTQYDDFETFRAYAETPTSLEIIGGQTCAVPVADREIHGEDVTYYDEDGNEIPAEVALRESVTVNGKTYEWMQYNAEIQFVEFSDDGSTITVETFGDWERAREEQAQKNSLYRLGISMESLLGVAISFLLSRYRGTKQTAAQHAATI